MLFFCVSVFRLHFLPPHNAELLPPKLSLSFLPLCLSVSQSVSLSLFSSSTTTNHRLLKAAQRSLTSGGVIIHGISPDSRDRRRGSQKQLSPMLCYLQRVGRGGAGTGLHPSSADAEPRKPFHSLPVAYTSTATPPQPLLNIIQTVAITSKQKFLALS